MDPKTLTHSLRALSTLNLVVSKEPLDVASMLAKLLTRLTREGSCRAVTRFGLMDIRAYLRGDTVVGHRRFVNNGHGDTETASADALEAMFRERTCNAWGEGEMRDVAVNLIPAPSMDRPSALVDEGHSKALAEAWKQDPRDVQLFYFVPDLWPDLSDPKILASLMRFKDERVFDEHTIKCVVVVTPSLDMVPEAFRSMFDIHYDTGFTEKQAREEIEGDSGFLRVTGKRAAPEHLDEIVKLVTGLSSGDVLRMMSHALVTQRRSATRAAGFITTEGMLEWRLSNGKPLPVPPPPPPTPVYRPSWERLGIPELEGD